MWTNIVEQIAELSTRTLDFSRHYAARAHQTQRSGPLLGSLPSLNEVEDMLHMQRRNQDALIRIRTAVVNQEQALAEQMAQRKAFKTEDDHMAMYQEEFKGTGGFAGADPKKRRGVSSRLFPFPLDWPWPTVVDTLPPTPQPECVWLTPFYRKRPLLVVATAVTEPKHQNGVGDQMVPGRCVTPAVYIMPSWLARWALTRRRVWVQTWSPSRFSTPPHQPVIKLLFFHVALEKEKGGK